MQCTNGPRALAVPQASRHVDPPMPASQANLGPLRSKLYFQVSRGNANVISLKMGRWFTDRLKIK